MNRGWHLHHWGVMDSAGGDWEADPDGDASGQMLTFSQTDPPADPVGCSQQRALEQGDFPVPGGLHQKPAFAGTSEPGEPGRLALCAERTAVLWRAEDVHMKMVQQTSCLAAEPAEQHQAWDAFCPWFVTCAR